VKGRKARRAWKRRRQEAIEDSFLDDHAQARRVSARAGNFFDLTIE
jgi:hypothetical protein